MAKNSDLWIVTDSETGSTVVAETKWTISRGQDTFGYNICTLYIDGKKVSRCSGGGYDMTGTVIGEWFQNVYQARLLNLKPAYVWCKKPYKPMEPGSGKGETYGLTFQLDATGKPVRAELDGACGKECMFRIGEMIGITFAWKR